MDATLAPSPSQEPTVITKHVQELSLNGDEPPPRYIRKDKDQYAPVNDSISSGIPVIDLRLLSSSSEEVKEQELAKLKSALSSWGFFQAIGHDIPSSLLDEVQSIAKEFFNLPMEEKNKHAINFEGKQDYLQGYGNDLLVTDEQVIEWSDRLYLMVKPLDQRNYRFWPENPARLKDLVDEYSMNVHMIAELILKCMAKSLGLQEDFLVGPVKECAPTFLRFNYYPPCSRPDLVYGIKPHSDGGAITILLQDQEVEGLQILKDGHWTKVPIIPNALLVNVADQVEIMSNGVFKSAMHRVITNSEKQRISLAMFYIPENENKLEPASELISDTTPSLFKKMKSADYIDIYFQRSSRGLRAIDAVTV